MAWTLGMNVKMADKIWIALLYKKSDFFHGCWAGMLLEPSLEQRTAERDIWWLGLFWGAQRIKKGLQTLATVAHALPKICPPAERVLCPRLKHFFLSVSGIASVLWLRLWLSHPSFASPAVSDWLYCPPRFLFLSAQWQADLFRRLLIIPISPLHFVPICICQSLL